MGSVLKIYLLPFVPTGQLQVLAAVRCHVNFSLMEPVQVLSMGASYYSNGGGCTEPPAFCDEIGTPADDNNECEQSIPPGFCADGSPAVGGECEVVNTTPAGFCEDGSPAVEGQCTTTGTTPAGFCEDGSPAVEGQCTTTGTVHQQDSVKMDHLQSKVNVQATGSYTSRIL